MAPSGLSTLSAEPVAPMSAQRLLTLTGIGMILAGMIFGDIFAVFVLHQNAASIGVGLTSAATAALQGKTDEAGNAIRNAGKFLENRGTKVDAHAHLIAFGYLALMLALVQPWVSLSERSRRKIAWLFAVGGAILPVGVFLIHYVGVANSPLQSIGWASIFADAGGFAVIVSVLAYLVGLAVHLVRRRPFALEKLPADATKAGRWLFAGGIFLVLAGMAHGAYYAQEYLYKHEAADHKILLQITSAAAARNPVLMDQSLAAYAQLQGDKAVMIAAHAHSIEFGLLALLLAFFQPYVHLKERWRLRWAAMQLIGSLLLPVFVLLETKYGLAAGAVADVGGLMVILALLAMWIGILRYSGRLDVARHGAEP